MSAPTPSPRRHDPRLAAPLAIAAFAAVAAAAWLLTSAPSSAGPSSSVKPAPRSGGDGDRTFVNPGSAGAASRQRISTALARAYAAAGEMLDGKRADCAALDAQSAAELGHARELLALAHPLVGAGRPTRLPDGTELRIDGAAPAEAAPPPFGSHAQVQRDGAAATLPGEAVARTAPVQADAASSLTVGSAKQPIPIRGDLVKELIAPDAWVAIPYKPGLVEGQPLVIKNLSGSGYAISVNGDDFGSVRVNGGLVVPGRYYRIDGEITVESSVPVGVHIRPLTAVSIYYPEPQPAPSANG